MIKDILIMQKRELKNKIKENYINRNINPKKIKNPLAKIIIGPRRSGKSFFAMHLLEKNENFGYVNFDDERLIELKDYDELIEAIKSIYNSKKILFDEIQNLPKWELFVNRLLRANYDLIITGSNSKLLSKELATHLTGRHFLINIFPFSFKEYLKIKDKQRTNLEIKSEFEKYLIFGGYPEPKIKGIDNKEYLKTLFDSIIYKDIVKRYELRHPSKIEDLAFYLLSNFTLEYSMNSLKNLTKTKSAHTIENYINYLEESFLFFKVSRFSYKLKEQISSIKKMYVIDNGFIDAKGFNLSPNYGRLYENLVAIKLKKDEMDHKLHFFYWKNQQQEEVDFLIKKGLKVDQLIQVCYDLKNKKTLDRETRALLKASKELKCDNLMVLTKDYEKEKDYEWFGIKKKIKFMPLYKWLLEEN